MNSFAPASRIFKNLEDRYFSTELPQENEQEDISCDGKSKAVL